MQALIVGCGDVGCRLALRLMARGMAVTGVVRSPSSAAALERLGIAALNADLDADVIADLPAADWLFHFAPPPETGDTDPRLVGTLAALDAPPSRLVYLSTSAVYGDCAGRWIDETESLKPKSARGHRRLDAERRDGLLRKKPAEFFAHVHQRREIFDIHIGEGILDHGDRRGPAYRPPESRRPSWGAAVVPGIVGAVAMTSIARRTSCSASPTYPLVVLTYASESSKSFSSSSSSSS